MMEKQSFYLVNCTKRGSSSDFLFLSKFYSLNFNDSDSYYNLIICFWWVAVGGHYCPQESRWMGWLRYEWLYDII